MIKKHANNGDDLASLAPALGGLVLGMPTGRALAGHTAAGIAPYGRKTRTDDIARRAAYVGAPLGGIAALGLSHHYDLPNRLAKWLGRGTIVDKDTEREAIRMLTPVAMGLGGSALGGLATGAITGGIQQARGPSRRRNDDTASNPLNQQATQTYPDYGKPNEFRRYTDFGPEPTDPKERALNREMIEEQWRTDDEETATMPPRKHAGVTMPRKYANLARALENPEVGSTIRNILMRPSPAMRGTLEIGAKGKRLIPEVEDISLETLRRQALRRPPAVAARTAPATPMHYEPGDIMTSAKMSAFLKRAQAYGAHLATMEFHRHTRDDFTKEAISPARARAAAEVALKRGMPDRAKRFAAKAQDISIARKAEMDYGATHEEARAMMPKRFLKGADAALGDPNFWQGGSEAQQAPPQPASAEEAIGLLPGGTFQGLNTRITADGQRSTTVKTTPDVMQDPSGIQAIFAAEPGAKVELSNPETAMPGTSVPVQGDNGGVPEGSPGQEAMPVSPIPEAAGKLAALIQAGRSQAREKLASMSTEERLRKIGPAVGATAGLVSAALSKQPKTLGHVLSRVGGGATVGWLPDIYASGAEALR